jgi:hypothetical protein
MAQLGKTAEADEVGQTDPDQREQQQWVGLELKGRRRLLDRFR